MSDLEQRLRAHLQASGELIAVPVGDSAVVARRGRMRRALTNIAVAAVAVVVVVVAGWVATRSGTPGPFITPNSPTTTTTTSNSSTTLGGPALQWHEAAGAPAVDRVLSAWAMTDGGFAVWSGTEIWTSSDGDTWSHAATTPEGVFSPDSMHPVVDFAGGWVGIGGETPTVFTSVDGASWGTVDLPTDWVPVSNPLLQRVISATFIARRADRVVIAGRINETPDPDAVVAALAPDLAGDGNQTTANLNAREVQVRDSAGNLVGSIPFTDIDPRLQYQANLISTILWSSPDGLVWDHKLLPGDSLAPASLLTADNRFVAATIDIGAEPWTGGFWESADGVAWANATEVDPFVAASAAAWGDKIVADAGQGDVTVFDPDWQRSTFPIPLFDSNVSVGVMAAGRVGLVVTAYDNSTESTPSVAMWFTPDGRQWSRQALADTFGDIGNVALAADTGRVLLILGPNQDGGAVPISPFQVLIGTPSVVSVTGSATTSAPDTTSTVPPPSTPVTAPEAIDSALQIMPATGAPGDPLTICGTLQGASQVRVVLSDPPTGDSWPDDIDEFVTPDESGRWCWIGTIPTELQSTDPRTLGKRHPITAGAYEIRVESSGDIIAYGSLKVTTPDGTLGAPSQSPADASRDGIVAELAELPIEVRVRVQAQVETPEGLWVLSHPDGAPDLLLGSCVPTDPGCLYGRDYIAVGEYGEVLLMDAAGQQILRAYPLPSFPFEGWASIVATDDAVYCASQGDGGLPDSMLCRIDRAGLDWIVRVFPFNLDSAFNPPSPDRYVPDNWTIDAPVDRALFLDLIMTPDGLVTVGYDEQIRVDPTTLQLLD